VKKLFILFFLCSNILIAQTSTLSGVLKSEGKVVEFANVGLEGTVHGTSSNEKGFFELKDIKPGKYSLQISAIGFKRYQQNITIKEGDNLKLNVNVESSTSQLNEVVITGTLKEVSLMESAVPIEVYTPAYFKKNPTPALFESLQIVNGVRPQINCSVCNTGDVHINGMEGPYTMVTIDGMPIVGGLASVYGLNGIPNSMIEQMEVVKGPASTLYGSEAVGGLINVITKSPERAPDFSFDIFGTTWGEINTD
jgi:outer membrane receptor for ferrienterochelin and colicins